MILEKLDNYGYKKKIVFLFYIFFININLKYIVDLNIIILRCNVRGNFRRFCFLDIILKVRLIIGKRGDLLKDKMCRF